MCQKSLVYCIPGHWIKHQWEKIKKREPILGKFNHTQLNKFFRVLQNGFLCKIRDATINEWPQAGEEIGERTVAQEKETEGATKDAHHFSEVGTQHFSQSSEMMINFPILRNDNYLKSLSSKKW